MFWIFVCILLFDAFYHAHSSWILPELVWKKKKKKKGPATSIATVLSAAASFLLFFQVLDSAYIDPAFAAVCFCCCSDAMVC